MPLEEVIQISMHLEEANKAFLKEHAYFEVSWPAALIDHEYFSNDAFAVEAEECMTARRALAKLKGALAEKIAPTTAPVAAQPSQSQQRLPDINIPSFKGVRGETPLSAALTGRPTSMAHHAAAQPARTNTSDGSTEYLCDCCNGTHFVVICPKFRELSPDDRQKLVILRRLWVKCLGRHNVRSYQSSRSKLAFVSESLVRQLNITRHHSVILITGIGGGKATQTRGIALLKLRSLHSRSDVIIQAHILQTLTNILPSFNAAPQEWPHLTKLTLADPDFLTPRPVDIIIGADSYGQIIKPNIIKQDTWMPIAQLSIFGWLVLGPVDTSSSASAAVLHASIQEREDALDELLSRFWTQEEVPANNNLELTPDEQRCEEHFKSTVSRNSTGRYTVRFPLKSSPDTFGDSDLTAHRCLKSLQRRLSLDDNYRRLYHQFMTEYRDLNHMKKASPVSSQQTQYYLPHHGVLKPDNATTKLRVVFNGSSASTSGRSLNDIMHTGAKLHLDVTDVLLWIRQFRHLVATDITKMYRQINVHEDD
ncbi:uncharacterized protein LOC143899311 [Temnothorax americanus]|uniref:uncharacterized protein LOC143899311 n=1 Tax=Temnothorax americanus TaxID=1964332 RepID=UPI004069495F